MKSTSEIDPQPYQWSPQPKAAQFVRTKLDAAISASPWLAKFKQRLLSETGTRLFDWLDHIAVNNSEGFEAAGFRPTDSENVYINPTGIFPKLTVAKHLSDGDCRIGLKVDRIENFVAEHEPDIDKQNIFGKDYDQVRLAQIDFKEGGRICIVERHGTQSMLPGQHEEATDTSQREKVLQSFRSRDRTADSEQGFRQAAERFMQAAAKVGKHYACDLFFHAEREYWQSRNKAAQIQFRRQETLGLGWANHDHHTYRCSRVWFRPMVLTFELMGFESRERFYAGPEAGWGAQVLEHPGCGIVIFADVDLTEDEITGDFAHDGLEVGKEYGTVGLWCKLHGDSFLAAGMHHLECQFDFEAARSQLAAEGIETMAPFTDFPHLRQAFTKGESWKVDRERLGQLLVDGVINEAEAQRFADEGVRGSHLEILERNDGYKGFNQTGVSKIILQTNPTLADE